MVLTNEPVEQALDRLRSEIIDLNEKIQKQHGPISGASALLQLAADAVNSARFVYTDQEVARVEQLIYRTMKGDSNG